jgi:hypothetical protein
MEIERLIKIIPANSLLDKILAYVDGCTDAPDEYILTSTLAAMATALGSNVWTPFGANSIYSNLYIIKIGESSRIRKTTSDRIVVQFLNEVCKDRVFPNDITPERLIAKMENSPSCLLRFTEIGGSFKKMESTRYLNGFKPLITEFYDNDLYQKELKGGKKDGEVNVVEVPCVSILGSSTLEWFQQGITMDDIASGLIPRFLFSYVKKPTKTKIIFPKKADPTLKDSIVEDFKLLMERWTGEKTLSKEALQIYEDWCKSTNAELDNDPTLEKVASFFDRIEKSVLKIALLMEGMLQVRKKEKFENVETISEPAINLAVQFGLYFQDCAKELVIKELKLNRFDSDMKRIVKALKKHGKDCPKRALSADTGIYGFQLRDILEAMEDLQMVENYSENTSGGLSFRVKLLNDEPIDKKETEEKKEPQAIKTTEVSPEKEEFPTWDI